MFLSNSPSPPWSKLGKKIESKIRKALHELSLLEEGEKIAIALSGGKDSLTLLYFLKAILGKGFFDLPLVAVHVNGAYSCGSSVDSNYLQKICDEIEVPLITKTSTISKESLKCYSCSRERRKLLFEGAKEAGCSKIAFGHHKDDAVETLLMNLLHKAEFSSMLAKVPMERYRITIIRPLIYVEEKEIVQFAKMHGFWRITCKCPVGQTSQRRKTADILHYLEKDFVNAKENLFQAGEMFGSKKALTP